MKRNLLKVIVPVLVLAMLLQVPFALSASASDLSQATSIHFTLTKADETAPGNCEIKMNATTVSTEKITTIGATLVINTDYYDLVNDEGNVVTDSYKLNSVQIGEDFPVEASAIGTSDGFEEIDASSLVSYNSTTKEMYVFIAGISAAGIPVSENAEIFTFYIQAKDGTVPTEENIRVMRTEEFRNTAACPAAAVFPGEISSKRVVLKPTEEDLVTDVTLTLPEVPQTGSISGVINGNLALADADAEVTLLKGTEEIAKISTGEAEFALENVEAGVYTVEISAPGSLGYKFLNVTVVAGEETTLPAVTLIYGDADNDGVITAVDVGLIINNMSEDYNVLYDPDGDGNVTAQDIGLVLLEDHFGVQAEQQEIDLLA